MGNPEGADQNAVGRPTTRLLAKLCPLLFIVAACQAGATTATATDAPDASTSLPGPMLDACAASDVESETIVAREHDGRTFGAVGAGPELEPPSAVGAAATPGSLRRLLRDAAEGEVLRLRSGCYSGFEVPENVTVAPYNGEVVVIQGQVTLASGATLAGVRVRSDGPWAVRVHTAGSQPISGAVVRHNDISGGSVESIRVSGNVSGAVIEGNLVSGGGNHVIKVHGDGTGYAPEAVIRGNVLRDAEREDSIQIEESGAVLIEGNTLDGAPEDNIDIKSGEVEITGNLFLAADEGSVLVHGSGSAIIAGNLFTEGGLIAIGSRNEGDASATISDNLIQSSTIVVRRTSRPVIFERNRVEGGVFLAGFGDGDIPAELVVESNVFVQTEVEDLIVPQGGSWVCNGNDIGDAGPGWPSDCD